MHGLAPRGARWVDDALDRELSLSAVVLRVVLDYEAGRPRAVARRAEEDRIDAHARPRLELAQYVRQRPVGRREEELVEIDERDPARIVPVLTKAVLIRRVLPVGNVWPFVECH